LGGRKGIRPVKTEWWGTGVVICLEQGADLHMAQLMPLPLTVSFSSKIQIGCTFLVPADLSTPGKRAVKRLRVCVTSLWDFDVLLCLAAMVMDCLFQYGQWTKTLTACLVSDSDGWKTVMLTTTVSSYHSYSNSTYLPRPR